MRLKGKKAIVSGGNSGIGRAIAKRFVQEGAQVAIIGRNPETLKETKDELKEGCFTFQGDVSKMSDLDAFYTEVKAQFNTLDILVMNAGVSAHGATETRTEEIYDHIMDINVKAPFFMVQKALPLLNNGASVLAISSISARLGISGHAIYSASKAALNRIIISFSAEFLESRKIRFNTISPGYTKTPIFKDRLEQSPNFLEESAKIVPVKRFASPDEIAHAALFLSSDEALYISGTDLVVDGGISSMYPLDKIRSTTES